MSAPTAIVYRVGICYASVCAAPELSVEEVAAAANASHPTGIDSRWMPSTDERFASGQLNPCPCEQSPGRIHWLLEC